MEFIQSLFHQLVVVGGGAGGPVAAGSALFTRPAMPINCAGATHKAKHLSCGTWRRRRVLSEIDVEFQSAGAALFGIPAYVVAPDETTAPLWHRRRAREQPRGRHARRARVAGAPDHDDAASRRGDAFDVT